MVPYFEHQVFKSHPAGSTGALVSDLLQSGTVGPLHSGVKLFWQLQVTSILNPEEENSFAESSISECHYSLIHVPYYSKQMG